MQKIRKGDKVVVLAGKDKGRTGEVLQVHAEGRHARVVRGVNLVRRHQQADRSPRKPASSPRKRRSTCPTSRWPIAKDGKPTRVGFKIQKDGKKVRVAKRSGDVIDG